MTALSFGIPLTVWLDPERKEYGQRRINSVEDGFRAVFRYGMGTLRPELSWKLAVAALARAQLGPSPDNVMAAREALSRLARDAGTLVDPDHAHGEAALHPTMMAAAPIGTSLAA